MRTKLLIFFAFTLIFHSELKAQKTNTEHRIESKVLFLAIDDIVLDKNIAIDSITQSTLNKFSIYNSYKSEWIKIIGYEFFPQPKLQDASKIVVNSDTLTTQVKKWFELFKTGDVLYIHAIAKINNQTYRVEFAFKMDGNNKSGKIIKCFPNSTLILLK